VDINYTDVAGHGRTRCRRSEHRPTLVITGSNSVDEGSQYVLTLGAVIDLDKTPTKLHRPLGRRLKPESYTVTQIASVNRQLTHTYVDGSTSRTVTVDLVDEDGTFIM